MKVYKKIVVKRIIFTISVFLFILALSILLIINANSESHTFSYFLGMTIGAGIPCILYVFKNYRLLYNEAKLNEKYIIEMDERNIVIAQKVQSLSFKVFVFVIAIFSLIFAAFNKNIALLLSFLLVIALMIKVGLYLYYKRKL